jgi:hypothetical protein
VAVEPGSGEAGSQGRPDAVPALPSPDDVRTLGKTFRTIDGVVTAIRNGDQVPNTLEARESPESNGTGTETGGQATVTRAENLFAMAVKCLKIVRRSAGHLRTLNWTKEQEGLFTKAYDDLTDGWSTYKTILGELGRIGWDDEAPRQRVLAGLAESRRAYIDLLDAYGVQLLVVLDYLGQGPDVTAGE